MLTGRVVPVRCSDHNLIALTKKNKIPKSGVVILHRRSFRRLDAVSFVNDISGLQWFDVCQENGPNIALKAFMAKLMKIVDKHAPLRKRSVMTRSVPWIDDELKALMSLRDNAKDVAQKSRNNNELKKQVTKLSNTKKKIYFKERI